MKKVSVECSDDRVYRFKTYKEALEVLKSNPKATKIKFVTTEKTVKNETFWHSNILLTLAIKEGDSIFENKENIAKVDKWLN